MTIGALSNNVLLDIFAFYRETVIDLHPVVQPRLPWQQQWQWDRLVHVCQRWQYIVFASRLRLDLYLYLHCTSKTPVRETLDVWPALPIEIALLERYDIINVIATLEHRDRGRNIWILDLISSKSEELVPMMQEPFPALTVLQLCTSETPPALPDMFLGGSAPTSTDTCTEGHSIPGIAKTSFICYQPYLSRT